MQKLQTQITDLFSKCTVKQNTLTFFCVSYFMQIKLNYSCMKDIGISCNF